MIDPATHRVTLYVHPASLSGCEWGDPRTVAELRASGLFSLRKGRASCARCGAALAAGSYTFAVVGWRGDGRYRLADAVATHARRGTAMSDARRRGPSYVVRALSLPND